MAAQPPSKARCGMRQRWLLMGWLAAIAACRSEKLVTSPIDGVLTDGKAVFRFDTFGDEAFWTDTLKMHQVVQGISPKTALGVGLKVDVDALPAGLVSQLKAGQVNLDDPATTVVLLSLNAVVGVQATVDATNTITRFGVTCALCHSTVDNSLAQGIGHRLDGWANRDLNPGMILSLSPALQAPATHAVLTSWGAGKYDAHWNHDNQNGPVLIPPAYGLAGVNLETYTGEGGIPYWNAYVAVTQMHGHGNFDATAAARGRTVFFGAATCATCHVPPQYTDAGFGLHNPAEVCADGGLATRSTTGKYRTTPLRALSLHPPYYHDGSLATLADVVTHYNTCLSLGLSAAQQTDLVQFLKSL